MKRKWITGILCLAVSLGVCAFSGCKDDGNSKSQESSFSQNSGESSVEPIELVDTQLTLEIGAEFQLRTTDGVTYDTYISDNAEVCSVTANGKITAKEKGTANVSVVTPDGTLVCVVTVTEKELTETQNVYHVEISSVKLVKVGDTIQVTAKVQRNGENTDENVTWSVSNESVTYTANGNEINITGATKGMCVISAAIGGFETSVTVKVYDNSCILNSPELTFAEGLVSWEVNENAVGYRITVNAGESWEETTETSYNIDGYCNPLNVAVVAIADENSEYVDSKYTLNTYAITSSQMQSATNDVSSMTTTGTEYVITPTNDVLLYVYGNDNALLSNGGEVALFADTAIVFDVKGNAGTKITFVSESVDGAKAISEFTVGETYQTIGYLLNAYGDTCYITADSAVTLTNVSLERNPQDFAYSSVYMDVLVALEDGEEDGLAYIKENAKYLAPSERALFEERASEELKTTLADVQFFGESVSLGDVTFNSAYTASYTFYEKGNGFKVEVGANDGNRDTQWIYFDTVLPDVQPQADKYIWNIYSDGTRNVFYFYTTDWVKKELTTGWNQVEVTWEELQSGKIIFQSGAQDKTATYILGSIVTVEKGEGVQFLNGSLYADTFIMSGLTATEGTDAEQGVCIEIVADNDAYGNLLNFGSYIPTEDPGYEYYIWNIHAEKAGKLVLRQKGDWTQKQVTLAAGWNEVKLTYADISMELFQLLIQEKNFDGAPETVTVKLGAFRGVNGVQFLDNEISLSKVNIFGGYTGAEEKNLSNDGKEYDLTISVVVNNDDYGALIDFTSYVPAEDPGYEYYVWNVYSEKAGIFIIKQKADWTQKQVTLAAGWNEVKLTYADMSMELFQLLFQEKNFEGAPETVMVKLGALRGVNGVGFLGEKIALSQLTVPNGYTASETHTLAESGTEYNATITLVVDNADKGTLLDFTSFIPTELPEGEQYVWNIYVEQEGNMIIRNGNWNYQTTKTLNAGWNQVVITRSELTAQGKFELYFTEASFDGSPETVTVILGDFES